MFYIVITVCLSVIIWYKIFKKPLRKSLFGRHVVITGGSSGIGKALAILAAKQGAHVSLLARNVEKLDEAQSEIRNHIIIEDQIITRVPVDVSNMEAVENNLLELEEIVGPIFMLVNCAGFAVCGKLEDIAECDIKHLIEVNLLGSIYSTKALLPKFKQRKEGIIVLTSSLAGLMGMFGYSVYSSCKFALRGLAECLVMELKPYHVSVTLALPPDTDTPGFENENRSKPKETKLISSTSGLYKPETVAKQLMNDALEGNFFSHVGLEGYILKSLCVGMSPFNSALDLLIQALILGPLRLISAFYISKFDNIVKDCFKETDACNKKN